MGKRGNGEGSISRRKGGGWMGQYVVHTAEGRKRRTVYGKTRADVAKKLARALSQREDGLVFDAGNLKVKEYLERWFKDSVEGNVRSRTLSNYQMQVRRHIVPTLGSIKLKALSPATCRVSTDRSSTRASRLRACAIFMLSYTALSNKLFGGDSCPATSPKP